ncbi:hypothetical protein AC578_8417 [Pseudocercospora eumusae]|uniref:Uncharacterized protein n=1 Tax=Pseudocercospora eumusae TaxID=321146 RepID=A0A139HS52_9PEZI|nr:hypothetical protein AC578_8417 [Pseudocercospora eumusae]
MKLAIHRVFHAFQGRSLEILRATDFNLPTTTTCNPLITAINTFSNTPTLNMGAPGGRDDPDDGYHEDDDMK